MTVPENFQTETKLREARAFAADAEACLIGCLLVLPKTALAALHDVRAKIEATQFANHGFRTAFEIICELADAGSAWEGPIVAPVMAQRLEWPLDDVQAMLLGSLDGGDWEWELAHLDDYVQAVLRAWQRRSIAFAIHDAAVALGDPEKLLLDIASKLTTDCDAALASADDPLERSSWRDIIGRVGDDTAETSEPIATRLDELDKLIGGGLRRGQLIFVGARPSMGKSALCQQIGLRFAEQEHPIFNLSFEMGESEVRKRWIAQMNLHMDDDDEVERSKALPMWSPQCAGWSIDRVETETYRMKIRHGIDLLIVDHTLLLVQPSKHMREIDQLTDITRRLKTLAQKLDIVVLAAHQFNRAKEGRDDNRPRMSDFKASGSIEQDADILMGLHRSLMPGEGHQATLFVLKQRSGPTGDVELNFEEKATKFSHYFPQDDF